MIVHIGVGYITTLRAVPRSRWLSFAAGGVVLNMLKEELPEERESHFWAFAPGLGAYAALLLTL